MGEAVLEVPGDVGEIVGEGVFIETASSSSMFDM